MSAGIGADASPYSVDAMAARQTFAERVSLASSHEDDLVVIASIGRQRNLPGAAGKTFRRTGCPA